MNNNLDIRSIRETLKLTQAELARKLKVDFISVSRWERGVHKPRRQVLKKLERLQRRNGDGK